MRSEDTAKAEDLQGQEQLWQEKDLVNGVANVKARASTPLDKLLAEDGDGETVTWGKKPLKGANDKELLGHLGNFQKDLGLLLAWKEDLRLLTVTHMVPAPYYDSWTKEANLFFRRLVIINKRLETLKKKQRA